jgi:hypothetical protein
LKKNKYPLKPIDRDGNKIVQGSKVIFLEAPNTLLNGLSLEDQQAISRQVGKILQVQGFDEYGHAELEFVDNDGSEHFIWIEPVVLKLIK